VCPVSNKHPHNAEPSAWFRSKSSEQVQTDTPQLDKDADQGHSGGDRQEEATRDSDDSTSSKNQRNSTRSKTSRCLERKPSSRMVSDAQNRAEYSSKARIASRKIREDSTAVGDQWAASRRAKYAGNRSNKHFNQGGIELANGEGSILPEEDRSREGSADLFSLAQDKRSDRPSGAVLVIHSSNELPPMPSSDHSEPSAEVTPESQATVLRATTSITSADAIPSARVAALSSQREEGGLTVGSSGSLSMVVHGSGLDGSYRKTSSDPLHPFATMAESSKAADPLQVAIPVRAMHPWVANMESAAASKLHASHFGPDLTKQALEQEDLIEIGEESSSLGHSTLTSVHHTSSHLEHSASSGAIKHGQWPSLGGTLKNREPTDGSSDSKNSGNRAGDGTRVQSESA